MLRQRGAHTKPHYNETYCLTLPYHVSKMTLINQLSYRFKQFWWGISARPLTADQRTAIQAALTPTEYKLYLQYSKNDQQHGYRVLQALLQAGYNHPDLLTAGILHDVGKSRVNMTVIDRTVVVLGQIFAGKQTAVWGKLPLDQAKRWQRPFIVREQHPQWSAEMAQAAGSSTLAVALMRHHQDSIETILSQTQDPLPQLLRQLQWADDLN